VIDSTRGEEGTVGPVVQPTSFGRAVVAAIQAENTDVTVYDEGAYIRVHTPRVCRVTKIGVEAQLGQIVSFPGDLEVAMPSFSGLVEMTEAGATWWRASEPKPEPLT
jgi:toluene monooxygenase system protein D